MKNHEFCSQDVVDLIVSGEFLSSGIASGSKLMNGKERVLSLCSHCCKSCLCCFRLEPRESQSPSISKPLHQRQRLSARCW